MDIVKQCTHPHSPPITPAHPKYWPTYFHSPSPTNNNAPYTLTHPNPRKMIAKRASVV